MFWDTTYILVIIGALICAGASLNVNQTYRRYSTFANRRGITAEAAAAQILRSAGITDVRIERIRGSLTDHYSPRERVLRLSDSVYGSTSVAAIGVAAHECGHAIQHQVGYFPLKLRSLSVPVANIGSMIYWPVILLGLILGYMELAQIGVLLLGLWWRSSSSRSRSRSTPPDVRCGCCQTAVFWRETKCRARRRCSVRRR